MLSTERPVRVTRVDRTVITLANPRVVGDSLIGNAGNPLARVAVLLRDVQRRQERGVGGTPSRWAARQALQVAGALPFVWLLGQVGGRN